MTVGEFIDECDRIEALIAAMCDPEVSHSRYTSTEGEIRRRVQRIRRMGLFVPKPAWTGLLIIILSVSLFAQRPNLKLTPGKIRTTDTSEICAASFRTKEYRHTTLSTKKHVCAAYKVARCPVDREMEIDHLVPLELGGQDDPANLWVQFAKYADGSPGYHVKDKLENELHRRVCAGQMKLPDAQKCLVQNWVSCYEKVFGTKVSSQ